MRWALPSKEEFKQKCEVEDVTNREKSRGRKKLRVKAKSLLRACTLVSHGRK